MSGARRERSSNHWGMASEGHRMPERSRRGMMEPTILVWVLLVDSNEANTNP